MNTKTMTRALNTIEKNIMEDKAAIADSYSLGDVHKTMELVKNFKSYLKAANAQLTNLTAYAYLNTIGGDELFDRLGYLLKLVSNERRDLRGIEEGLEGVISSLKEAARISC